MNVLDGGVGRACTRIQCTDLQHKIPVPAMRTASVNFLSRESLAELPGYCSA